MKIHERLASAVMCTYNIVLTLGMCFQYTWITCQYSVLFPKGYLSVMQSPKIQSSAAVPNGVRLQNLCRPTTNQLPETYTWIISLHVCCSDIVSSSVPYTNLSVTTFPCAYMYIDILIPQYFLTFFLFPYRLGCLHLNALPAA